MAVHLTVGILAVLRPAIPLSPTPCPMCSHYAAASYSLIKDKVIVWVSRVSTICVGNLYSRQVSYKPIHHKYVFYSDCLGIYLNTHCTNAIYNPCTVSFHASIKRQIVRDIFYQAKHKLQRYSRLGIAKQSGLIFRHI